MAAKMRFLCAFCLMVTGAFGADAVKGKELFRACTSCHNYETDTRKAGPSLRTLFGKVTLRSGARATEENVRELILEGFNRMPSYRYQFRAEEFDDLIAFLKTLNARPAVETKAATGKDLFAAYCGRCHGAERTLERKKLTDAELLVLIEDGHAEMKGTRNWLDAASTKALLAYVKSL